MTKEQKRNIFILIVVLLLIVLLLYFFTYVFAKKGNRVIYEGSQKRIYLLDKKEYKKGREMWRMIYEDQKTGKRLFILGNSKKGFSDEKMSKIVLNTLDQGKMRSFDNVQGAGVTMRDAKTDIHSNMIDKSGLSEIKDVFKEMDSEMSFENKL